MRIYYNNLLKTNYEFRKLNKLASAFNYARLHELRPRQGEALPASDRVRFFYEKCLHFSDGPSPRNLKILEKLDKIRVIRISPLGVWQRWV